MGRSCEYDETLQIITVYYSGKMWEDHVRWSTWSSKRIESQLGNRLHLFGNKDKRVVCIMVHVQFDVSSCIVASKFPQIPVRVRQSSVASLPLNLNLFALHFPCECRQPPRHVEQNIAKHSCPRDWQTTNSNRWIHWTTLNSNIEQHWTLTECWTKVSFAAMLADACLAVQMPTISQPSPPFRFLHRRHTFYQKPCMTS